MTGEISCAAWSYRSADENEELLAALRGGIKTVMIPEDNAKDLPEIPDNVKNGLDIIPVARDERRAAPCTGADARGHHLGSGCKAGNADCGGSR